MSNRNVWCSRYSECLDNAVRAGKSFDCSGCDYFFDKGGRGEVEDLSGVCRFIGAMFYQEAYRRYLEDKKKELSEKRYKDCGD